MRELALLRQGDRNGVLRETMDEVGGAIERVDNPFEFGFARGLAGLFR